MINRSKNKQGRDSGFAHVGLKEATPTQSGSNETENQINVQDRDALYFLTLILLMLVTFFLFKADFMALLYSSAV